MNPELHVQLSIRLFTAQKCFGPGVAQLLHRVEEHRSLRAAAFSMEMAYSKAWKIVKTAEQELGFKLLRSTAGGKNGGGAQLTEQAVRLLEHYEAYCAELRAYADRLFAERFADLAEAGEKDAPEEDPKEEAAPEEKPERDPAQKKKAKRAPGEGAGA